MWGIASADLNATLLCWKSGDGVAEHINAERDVLIVIIDGSGLASIDGHPHALHPHQAILIARGARRQITAGSDGLRYLSIHRRRGPLQIHPHTPNAA